MEPPAILIMVAWSISLKYRMTDSIGEILKGIRCYFDKALPVMLLYKKERKQYHEAVVDNVSPSTVYGAEHLLRLFGMFVRKALYFCLMRTDAACLDYDVLLSIYAFILNKQWYFIIRIDYCLLTMMNTL